jgi:hypothetical protein
MAKSPEVVSEFDISARWQPAEIAGADVLVEATAARLKIEIAGQVATAFRTDRGDAGTEIHAPAYNVAEWIAENWWALLYEPQKSDDDEDDAEFRARHWLGSVRQGFALPDLWLFPAGDQVEISVRPAYLRHARLSFESDISASIPIAVVRDGMARFVEQTVERMRQAGHSSSALQYAWKLVRETKAEAFEFCRMMGSLGLSPYDEHPDTEAIIDRLSDVVDSTILRDLCLTSRAGELEARANVTESIYKALPNAPAADLSPLADLDVPADVHPAAWRRGIDAIRSVRGRLGFSSSDPKGSETFFSALQLDPKQIVVPDTPRTSDVSNELPPVSGAVKREATDLRFVLAEERVPQRRFAAARGAFLGWAAQQRTSRLVTSARTRDQQASRAFAAELLAPIAYIRSKARNRLVSTHRIDEIADELCVSPMVVRYQAQNNGLNIV